MNKRSLTVILVIVTVGGILALTIFLLNSSKNQPKITTISDAKRVSYTGQLESVDTKGMATDAPGIYKVRVDNSTVTVGLDAGESACDRTAIRVPGVKVGDKVSVSGDRGTDGIIQVCATGTYIKAAN